MLSMIGTLDEPGGLRIALINLGGHRVTLTTAGDCYEASWRAGVRRHRLSLAPTTLRDFTALLFGLCWPG
jgi:hypothetical protein